MSADATRRIFDRSSAAVLRAGQWPERSVDSNQIVAQSSSEFAVGWGTLSLINAGLAQSKGRSGFNWWFASIFLGPFCTFALVVLERLPDRGRKD